MKMKLKHLCYLLFMAIFIVTLAACDEESIDVFKDIAFNDVEVEYNGSEQDIELTGVETLPEGYTVEYTNNRGTESGYYYAVANVKNASGEVEKTYRATMSIVNPKNEEFEAYLDNFFVEYLEEDQLTVNIFCEKPEDFGLEHYEAKWYTYEEATEEELVKDKEYLEDLLVALEAYKDARLSKLQQVAYNKVEKFLTEQIALYDFEDIEYMRIVYVDSFGGYVADFATYMEAYSLRSEQEVKDIVSYIESTSTAFPSYVNYVAARKRNGYALSKYTITEMRKFLDDIINQGDKYYLADALGAKVDAVDFLNDAEKTDYKNKIKTAMTDHFFPAINRLNNSLKVYATALNASSEGYWTKYKNGKELYLHELDSLLGLNDFNYETYIEELENALSDANADVSDALNNIIAKFNISTYDQLDKLIESNAIYNGKPNEMMGYLKEFAKTIVPDLATEPTINIKEMDVASAKVSNAVAYYMKSALDNTVGENITLNPLKVGGKTELLSTLAHEGYPGHLYAYVYSKEIGQHNLSTIMTSTAHAEGWATYVELKLYDYAMAASDNSGFIEIMKYLKAQRIAGFLFETIVDARIHCESWTVSQVANYMVDLGYASSSEDAQTSAKDVINLLIEMPTQYAAYGYGKYFFINLHEEAQEILGQHYNEVEFNAMLLSRGWTCLGELQNTYNEYMKAKCHKYDINFVS